MQELTSATLSKCHLLISLILFISAGGIEEADIEGWGHVKDSG